MTTIVSVEEIKQYLKIEFDDEDELLEDLILQAQTAADDYCRVEFEGLGSVPGPVKLAVTLMATHFYENRDNTDRHVYNTFRAAFEDLLYPYRDPDKLF